MTTYSMSQAIATPLLGVTGNARVSDRVSWPWPLPMNSVLAIFDDGLIPQGLRHALAGMAVRDGDIWVLSGVDGSRRLRGAFQDRSAFSRVRSLLGDEDEVVTHLEARLARGGSAVLVRATPEDAREIAAAFAAHGARYVRRSGRLTSEWTVSRA